MKKWIWLLPAAGCYGIIFALSSKSSFPVPEPFSGFDKIIHGTEFAALGFLLGLGFQKAVCRPGRWTGFLAFITGGALGLLDELHQAFVPLRSPDLLDAAVDAAGAALGIIAFLSLGRWREKRKRPKPGFSG
jgi:VanZ family protein